LNLGTSAGLSEVSLLALSQGGPGRSFASIDHCQTVVQDDHVALDDTRAERNARTIDPDFCPDGFAAREIAAKAAFVLAGLNI
jgi:hypothetical protein